MEALQVSVDRPLADRKAAVRHVLLLLLSRPLLHVIVVMEKRGAVKAAVRTAVGMDPTTTLVRVKTEDKSAALGQVAV
jgi:hypothetical protein